MPTLSTCESGLRLAMQHATDMHEALQLLVHTPFLSFFLSSFGPTFEIFANHSSRTYVRSPSIIPRLVRRPKDSCLSSNLCVKTMATHYILEVSLFGIFAYGVSVRDGGINRVGLSWDESNMSLQEVGFFFFTWTSLLEWHDSEALVRVVLAHGMCPYV